MKKIAGCIFIGTLSYSNRIQSDYLRNLIGDGKK
jgi:hypothetical protein